MTTKVTITNDSTPQHTPPHDVTVKVVDDDGANRSEMTLTPGKSGEWHVFGGMHIEVSEASAVATEAAATA